MTKPLEPWTGPDEAPSNDEGASGYLLMAGVACGLIMAVGLGALAGHLAERPELAAADPLMTRLIGAARWAGWALAGLSGLAWLWSLARKKP